MSPLEAVEDGDVRGSKKMKLGDGSGECSGESEHPNAGVFIIDSATKCKVSFQNVLCARNSVDHCMGMHKWKRMWRRCPTMSRLGMRMI